MLFVSTVLVGCGTTAETKIDEKATEKTSVSKKVLNLMENSEIGSMDSIFTQDEASINAQSNVFEGLYQLDEKDQLIPAAAKEMPEISEDGKRYTIKLREDGKWSNGDAVTANDFVFAWRKLANPKNQANYFFLLEGTILNGTAITKEEKHQRNWVSKRLMIILWRLLWKSLYRILRRYWHFLHFSHKTKHS